MAAPAAGRLACWLCYRDKLLSPLEIGSLPSDANFYIGRCGGYDLGDPPADPHGQGAYRTVVKLDGKLRQFALESRSNDLRYPASAQKR